MDSAWRLALLVALCLGATLASAQSSGGHYTMRNEVIAGGGTRAGSGTDTVTGTVAQPTASPTLSGGTYRLSGGFHGRRGPAVPLPERVFCNSFESTPCP